MLSHAFVRSLRLCKTIYEISSKNFTKFSIRINYGSIGISQQDRSLIFTRSRGYANGPQYINVSSSILPFTFDTHRNFWGWTNYDDVFRQMKWPFTNSTLRLNRSDELEMKPYMKNIERLVFWYGGLSTHLNRVNELKWSSGMWNFKATIITGYENRYDDGFANYMKFVPGLQRIKYAENPITQETFDLYFLKNPGNSILLLLIAPTKWHHGKYTIFTDIRSLSDVVKHQSLFMPVPFDYSNYQSDPDADIDIDALCYLLMLYGPVVRPVDDLYFECLKE